MKTQLISDKLAMTLSFACIVHCFFAPSIMIIAYGFLSFSLDNELIHYAILMIALPISIIALSLGYRNHRTISFLIIGLFGLSLLTLAVFIGDEMIERIITLSGALIVAFAHFRNHQICKELNCSCHET